MGNTEATRQCTHCKVVQALPQFYPGGHPWCKTCVNMANRRTHAARRLQVLQGYGGKCVCCDETEVAFLTIDHIAGGGREFHRRYGSSIWSWLRGRKFPPEWQLLCANCNFAKGMYKSCPHRGSVETTRGSLRY